MSPNSTDPRPDAAFSLCELLKELGNTSKGGTGGATIREIAERRGYADPTPHQEWKVREEVKRLIREGKVLCEYAQRKDMTGCLRNVPTYRAVGK